MTRADDKHAWLPKIATELQDLVAEALSQGKEVSFRVTTDSMKPTIHPGDRVVVKKAIPDEIQDGDIINFRAGQGFLCHRLVRKEKVGGKHHIITKGDNRAHEDIPFLVAGDAILGKVIRIIRDGK